MPSDEQFTREDSKTPERRPKLEFFYYEQVGDSHYVLRLTWLTVILVFGLTVTSLTMILAIFFLSDRHELEKDVNLNITVPSRTPYSSDKPILRQPPPPPSPPKVNVQSNIPAPMITPTPNKNTNEQLEPKQTPQPSLSKPPT